jgi:hypothetical protein
MKGLSCRSSKPINLRRRIKETGLTIQRKPSHAGPRKNRKRTKRLRFGGMQAVPNAVRPAFGGGSTTTVWAVLNRNLTYSDDLDPAIPIS